MAHMPKFMALKVIDNACRPIFEEWLQKAFYLLRSAIVVAAVVLMAGLYSRIVYTLWLKRDPAENQLTFQPRVSNNEQVQQENIFLLLPSR